MMRKFMFLCLLAVALTACQNKSAYTINGNVVDNTYEGQQVYLEKWNDTTMVKVDSTTISNGKFQLKGEAAASVLRFITFGEDETKAHSMVMIEPGEINIAYDSVFTIVGTPINDHYADYTKKEQELSGAIQLLSNQSVKAKEDGTLTDSLFVELRSKVSKLWAESVLLEKDFLKGNMNNELGQYLFLNSLSKFDYEQQKEIIALADEDYKKKDKIKGMIDYFEAMDNVAVGKDYIDFTMENLEGESVSLSEYVGKNKYIFIDFWASWCGPCRAEVPGLIEAYGKYKSKGLEIVGVSLDRDKDKWIEGVKDLKMTWPQMSDMKYWESPVVQLYAIKGIPHTVLLDENGTIIANNLRGKMLEAKLSQLMD